MSDELESPRMPSVIFDACHAWLMHGTMPSEKSSVKDFSLGSKVFSFIYSRNSLSNSKMKQSAILIFHNGTQGMAVQVQAPPSLLKN